ncbi:hypothetical protein [Actinophytocola xinjiangensis]|uniref:hypothetical protein n=1 Tax=Actinophytocola xinjiangensis TaxID=485602 RepID=UPI0012B93F30|nr:hypothetical protein [Actinophytocola xinjiangensis]
MTEDGVLWLLKDQRTDWPDWPKGMGVTEPPVCLSCVPVAARQCPALRKGAAAIRARSFPVSGVRAMIYRSGPDGLNPIGEKNIPYGNSALRWARAMNLIRKLNECTVVSLEELCQKSK